MDVNTETAGYPPPSDFYATYSAGFWQRFFASLIDAFIVGAISFVVGFFLGIVLVFLGDSLETNEPLGNILSFVVSWLYFALQESSATQATFGKQLMGIYVADIKGNRITFGRATGRYFGKMISTLILFGGYLMQPFTPKRQTLHDIMAGCLVLKNVNKK